MADKKRKRLTTYQISNMLEVSDQSVSNWIDSGLLPAERTPGGHRRVDREDLIAFLKKQNMRIPPELPSAPPTILVVDDDPQVAQWISTILTENCPGFRILVAFDGFTAGKMIAVERPDLVILDLFMPGMDGFEVCRQIKTDPKTQTIAVVAITAQPSVESEKAIRKAGAEWYLQKPLDPKGLVDLVGTILNPHK